jgi:hypothetical protein
MHIEEIEYRGVAAYRLSNDTIELIVLTGVGPRVIHAGLLGKENLFAVFDEHFSPDAAQQSDTYHLFGGHRLWHAPEHPIRTYQPDNAPVAVTVGDGEITFTQTTEAHTGIQKTITIRIGEGGRVELHHTLTNQGMWPVTLAGWTLSVMAAGGVAVLPLLPRTTHSDDTLLPNGRLVLWPYTDLSDSRWTFARDFVLLRQDTASTSALKIGADVPAGWLAYAHPNGLFIKHFDAQADVAYPDDNSQAELYTDARILELETLSPVITLQPHQSLSHREAWNILPPVALPTDDASIHAGITPHV